MTKILLLGGALATALTLTAAEPQNESFFFDDLGEVNGVADNGRFAAIGDPENNRAYLWDSAEPDLFREITPDPEDTENLPSAQRITGALAYDVTDDGSIAVGSLYYRDDHTVPAIYTDGTWRPLPLHASSMNTNEAIAITPDGKTIAGYSFIYDRASEIGGRYYPCQWTLDDSGNYTLHAYTDIELPDHQGFFPMTQSPDGRVIAGTLYCGMSSQIPVLLVDGELKIFDELTEVAEPWIYKGKYYCGVGDDGKQIWSEDPNDPRIELFTTYYIDGWRDTSESLLTGLLCNCDANGNFYGRRTLISNVDEEGNATLTSVACIYNLEADEWYDTTDYTGFSAGVGRDLIFTENCKVIKDGVADPISDAYEIVAPSPLAGVSKISIDGTVLGGMRYEVNPASGEYQYFPFMTITEDATVGVKLTVATSANRPAFLLRGNTLTVSGTEKMSVYTADGALVGTGLTVQLPAGTYVAKAGAASAKFIVK